MGIRIREMVYHKIKLNKIFSRITGKPEEQVGNKKIFSFYLLYKLIMPNYLYVLDYVSEVYSFAICRLIWIQIVTISWVPGRPRNTGWLMKLLMMGNRDWLHHLQMQLLLRQKPGCGISGKSKEQGKRRRICHRSINFYRTDIMGVNQIRKHLRLYEPWERACTSYSITVAILCLLYKVHLFKVLLCEISRLYELIDRFSGLCSWSNSLILLDHVFIFFIFYPQRFRLVDRIRLN